MVAGLGKKSNFFISKKVYVSKYMRACRKRVAARNRTVVEFVFLGVRYKYEPEMLLFQLFGTLFGVGFLHQIRFLNFLKVSLSFRMYQYSDAMRGNIEIFLRRLLVGYNKRLVVENFFYEKYKRNCYHSIRLKMGLPVRGQRTRSNAGSYKQKRGRRTVVVKRKK